MRFTITILLYAIALTPLIEWRNMEIGATAGKIIVFRAFIEAALLFLLALRVWKEKGKPIWKYGNHPVAILLFLFLVSMAGSAIVAENPTRAFWGTLERGEGVFGMIHYFLLFCIVARVLKEAERMMLLKIFLVSGYVLLFYGFQEIPQGISRITSFVGNAAFFAGHLLFLIAVALLVMKGDKKRGAWWYVAAAFIPLGILGIALSGTRSALLGIGVGSAIFAFSCAYRKFGKKAVFIAALLGILGIAGVWANKPEIESVLERRADSIETRLLVWKSAFLAFQEKPVLGWGGEHFILASSVHHDPKQGEYGEAWFDRAHNKILDALVAEGIIGGIIFLGLLGAVFFKKTPVAIAFGGAYSTHALFTPPEFVSWLGFVVFLAVIYGEQNEKENAYTRPNVFEKIGAVGLGILAFGALWYGNILPFVQLKDAYEARGAENPMPALQKTFAKETFALAEARASIFDFYMEKRPGLIQQKNTKNFIREQIRLLAQNEPEDIRHGIRYARVLLEQGAEDEAFYLEAEKEIQKLILIAPNRLETHYLLAKTKGLQGNTEGAIEAASRAVMIAPRVARAHVVLGAALALSKNPNLQKQAEQEFVRSEELNPGLTTLMPSDLNTLIQIYKSRGREDRIADIAFRNAEGIIPWTPFDKTVFLKGLLYFAKEKKKEEFMKVAHYIGKRFPEEKEAALQAAEFAERGKWDIIREMFEIE